MATVTPFRAWHYDPQKVALERVIAPPYDVISAEDERLYHARDPHNIIRLVLGQSQPANPRPDQAYQDARKFLDAWISERALVQPSQDAYYLYEMRYEHPYQQTILTRLALFGALKLEPFERKVVFPHERTHSTAKVDRAKLLQATGSNFSPIFILYEDQAKTLDQVHRAANSRAPLFDFTDLEKIGHKLWVIDQPEEVQQVARMFDGRRVYIADGHHRYETALRYAEEKNKIEPAVSLRSWDYVLSAFVTFDDPGLLILPIHRMVMKTAFQKEKFLELVKQHFVIHPVTRPALESIAQGKMPNGFGIAFSESECYMLELKDETTARQAMPAGKPARWYSLDVNLISFLILKPMLGTEEQALERSMTYTSSTEEAFQKLGSEAGCALFLAPTTPGTIKEMCESGELMPQKSTYFYPKFPSGLLIYRHEHGIVKVRERRA